MSTTNESASAVTDRDHVAGVQLSTITDEFMRERLATAKPYTLMLLKKTPEYRQPDADPIVWEHGRRNMALEQHGALAIVLPVGGDELAGIGIFDATPKEVTEIMNADPGIQAGIFTCELHPARGFPSSALP